MQGVKALFFDVFGTLVDWRRGVARDAELVLKPLEVSLDWVAFADAWRDQYQPAMEEVRSGRIPYTKLDVLHRRTLEKIWCQRGSRSVEPKGSASGAVDAGMASARCVAGRAGGSRGAQAAFSHCSRFQWQHRDHVRSCAPE